jgi:hypothetical protein
VSGVIRRGGVSTGRGDASTASVDFNREAFTKLLADKGYAVRWQKAAICPNRMRGGGLGNRDHALNCKVCENGLGWIYFQEVDTQMLMTGMGVDHSYYAYGRWEGGNIAVTALPDYRLNYFDRLILKNGIGRFHELMRRQPATLQDRTKYTPLCVENLSWVDRSGVLQTFREDTHFTIVNGFINWLGLARPDDGTYFSISYEYRPQYVITDLIHQHRDSTIGGVHVAFPVQATARLDFLVRDESKDAPEQVEGNPFPQ